MLQKTWHLYIDFYRRCDVVSTDCLIPENVVHIHLLVTINLINPHSALRGNRRWGSLAQNYTYLKDLLLLHFFKLNHFPIDHR